MGYWITRFDTVVLQTANAVHDVGMPAVYDGIVELPGGGAYDGHGAGRAPVQLPYRLSVQAEIVEASAAAMQSAWYALRALVGQKAKLYRSPDDGSPDSEWVWARLVELPASRRADHLLVLPFTMVFEIWSPCWYGAPQDDTTILNTSPKTVVASNEGNVRVTNPLLTLTAGSAAITAATIVIAGMCALEFSGTVAIDEALVIDCGARSVLNDGADAYADFALGAGHLVDDWLRLEPGDNDIVVTLAGGSTDSTLRVQFADGWA